MPTVIQGALLGVIAVLLFGLIIFVHEFGHFFVAKLSHIRVNAFALGMGPKLFSFRRGETEYSLCLLPIGGYCAMEGEDESSDDPHAFGSRPVWQRMLVVVAGGVMNILLAIVFMLILRGQNDIYATTQIAKFAEGSALQAAGAQPGDYITAVDGYAVYTDQDLTFGLSMASLHAENEPVLLDISLRRGAETIELEDVPMHAIQDEDGNYHIRMDFYVVGEPKTVLSLVGKSLRDIVSTVRMVYSSLFGMITGKFGFNELSGPVGTAQAVTQVAASGLESGFGDAVNNIIYIMMIIAVNLGIVNLLPLPALDGGRLVFLLIEAIFRRPVPPKYEGWVHAGGMALLLTLMLAVTFQDILRIFTGA